MNQPLTVSAELPLVFPPVEVQWTDSERVNGTGLTWTVRPLAAGALGLHVWVADSRGDHGSANATVFVEGPPRLELGGSTAEADLGRPVPVRFNLSGGVAPYSFSWFEPESGAGGNLTGLGPGGESLLVEFPQTGPGWIFARAVDAAGGTATNATSVAEVVPPAQVSLFVSPVDTEVGAPVSAVASVVDGALPIRWSLDSPIPISSGAPLLGTLPTDGTIRWNGSFGESRTSALVLTTIDASGFLTFANASLWVAPRVEVNLSESATEQGGSLLGRLVAQVREGYSPYAYRFDLSDGESAVGNTSGPGPVDWSLAFGTPGLYTGKVSITDALGQTAFAVLTFRVTLPSPAPSASYPSAQPAEVGLLGALLLGGVGVAGVWVWRRRVRTAPPAQPDDRSAVAVLHRLLTESPGLDREMLLLLAEEEGETPATVLSALDRLVRSGRVAVEPAAGNEESLRWRTGPPADGERPGGEG